MNDKFKLNFISKKMKKFSNIINIFIFASLIITIKGDEDIKTIIPDEKSILKMLN